MTEKSFPNDFRAAVKLLLTSIGEGITKKILRHHLRAWSLSKWQWTENILKLYSSTHCFIPIPWELSHVYTLPLLHISNSYLLLNESRTRLLSLRCKFYEHLHLSWQADHILRIAPAATKKALISFPVVEGQEIMIKSRMWSTQIWERFSVEIESDFPIQWWVTCRTAYLLKAQRIIDEKWDSF